ncbi:cytokine receptor-like factor 3 [Saccostrea echinata]|uniref:cytokine receptor-like factor 3 n=1 Tax=Saccostrea echinata TaxID=191078 RepID=UPI002A83F72B|nr:cytokine receptor-like factor 3 [Saccostrea echinata]XP_061180928.1 cytokine receptor-like factor 3 [Saccostrea echinata]XP_061192441.1 cytokine receptor-like factor 3 [Saccostrea echinata]
MAQQLVQNVVDIMDNAHSQQQQLTESMKSLSEAKQQVKFSAEQSKKCLKEHFKWLEEKAIENLTRRLNELLSEVDRLSEEALSPLTDCEAMLNAGISAAARVMEDGKKILSNNPNDHIEDLVKFKDNPDTKQLHSVPEIPSLADVSYLSVDSFHPDLENKLHQLFENEGRVLERAPAQISEIEERPGSLLITWTEVDEEVEAGEFCLQYCYGRVQSNEDKNVTFHTAYTGPNTSCKVRHLRTSTPYSFRVRSRPEGEEKWSIWSVPRTAVTTIPHYQWNNTTEGYSTSNEDKTATRLSEGPTEVLYSSSNSYRCGFPITFRVLDAGEKTPFDGIGLSANDADTETLQRSSSIFVATSGSVYVDGQEMKTKLPMLTRGSSATIETEDLGNGKVRVSIEVEGKAVTFDWKVEQPMSSSSLIGLGMGANAASVCLFFGMKFSHEDWKVGVE